MKKMLFSLLFLSLGLSVGAQNSQNNLVDYVNPFIGTTNFGTTNPGAVTPNGMMSVVPFNVMGSEDNKYDKDSRWWSTPYENTNTYFTGFAQIHQQARNSWESDLSRILVEGGTQEQKTIFYTALYHLIHLKLLL